MSLAILIGLGARILVQKAQTFYAPQTEAAALAVGERVLSGLWQGALVHYVLGAAPQLASGIFVGIGARVVLAVGQLLAGLEPAGANGLAAMLIGIALGVLAADLLEAFIPRPSARSLPRGRPPKFKVKRRLSSPARPETISSGDSRLQPAAGRIAPHADGEAEPVPVSQLELEIADLQAQAAAEGAQRRRFEEERKWTLDSKNFARASQLAWLIQRCETLERSYGAEARKKMRELEEQNYAVHVDVFGRSYLDDIIVHIEDRLHEARLRGKIRLRIALTGPRDQVEDEIKPIVKTHFMRMKRRVVQDRVDPSILYIDVDQADDTSTTTDGVKSDEWSRALD
ncbi:hypothetical protein AURDEDRAFT_181142 [Auricularia subglabra TFB-10046 SS5]|nr:hypothetical protein AURDEDRAFT_181142 [Auricularia subglabra TFB-10046 SS5]